MPHFNIGEDEKERDVHTELLLQVDKPIHGMHTVPSSFGNVAILACILPLLSIPIATNKDNLIIEN